MAVREDYGVFPLFTQAVKKRVFDDIKGMLGVDSREELIERCKAVQNECKISNWDYRLPLLEEAMGLEAIATI